MLERNSSACISKIIPCCKFQNTVYLFYILIFGSQEPTLFAVTRACTCARNHSPPDRPDLLDGESDDAMYVCVICLKCTELWLRAREQVRGMRGVRYHMLIRALHLCFYRLESEEEGRLLLTKALQFREPTNRTRQQRCPCRELG